MKTPVQVPVSVDRLRSLSLKQFGDDFTFKKRPYRISAEGNAGTGEGTRAIPLTYMGGRRDMLKPEIEFVASV